MSRDSVEITFNAAVLDTPLFRPSDRVRPWTYGAVYNMVLNLIFRFGYKFAVTFYAIRRGAANILSGEFAFICGTKLPANFVQEFATSTETGLVLGHKNPRILQEH